MCMYTAKYLHANKCTSQYVIYTLYNTHTHTYTHAPTYLHISHLLHNPQFAVITIIIIIIYNFKVFIDDKNTFSS